MKKNKSIEFLSQINLDTILHRFSFHHATLVTSKFDEIFRMDLFLVTDRLMYPKDEIRLENLFEQHFKVHI